MYLSCKIVWSLGCLSDMNGWGLDVCRLVVNRNGWVSFLLSPYTHLSICLPWFPFSASLSLYFPYFFHSRSDVYPSKMRPVKSCANHSRRNTFTLVLSPATREAKHNYIHSIYSIVLALTHLIRWMTSMNRTSMKFTRWNPPSSYLYSPNKTTDSESHEPTVLYITGCQNQKRTGILAITSSSISVWGNFSWENWYQDQ